MDLWAASDLCTPWCIHVVVTLRIAGHILAGTADIDGLAAASGADSGTGALLAEVLRARPAIHGTLVDLPRTVAPAARRG